MKIIPINAGYYRIKSINNQVFNTRVEKSFINERQGTTDLLEYNGDYYIVGDGEFALDLDKTQNEVTKICILNMLARFTDNTEEFKVVITTPPLLYPQQKIELPKYLKGEYKVKHNCISKTIIIKDVYVFPETITAYIANNANGAYNGRKVVIIDIGGLTTNGCLINENGGFMAKDIFTIENGMYHIDDKISQYLNRKYYLSCTVDDINYFRKKGLYINGDKDDVMIREIEYMEDVYCKHIQTIMQQCQLKKWNINTYDVLITGGGGMLLYNTIKEYFLPQAKLSKDPIFDNLNGLVTVAKKVYEQ